MSNETIPGTNSNVDVDEGEMVPVGLQRKQRARTHAIAVGAIVVLVVGVVMGGRWLAFNKAHVTTDDAQVEPDIYPVSARIAGHIASVGISENDPVRAGQVLAEIDPRDYQVALDQAVAALAQAKAGAAAAAGTVNVTARTGGAGISQAEAGVASAQAREAMSESESASARSQVKSVQAAEKAAESGVEMARRQAASAQAGVTSARANADQARKDAARMEALVKQGAVSTQQRDAAASLSVSAQANVEAAEAQLSAAQAAVAQARERQSQATLAVAQAREGAAAAESAVAQARAAVQQAMAGRQSSLSSPEQVKVRQSEAGSAKAMVAAAEARLEQAKLNLSYTRIVVADRWRGGGEEREGRASTCRPGSRWWRWRPDWHSHVMANFKETQLKRIRPGAEGDIHGGRISGSDVLWRGGIDQPGHGVGVQPAAAGECIGQLHEGGAAGSGADHGGGEGEPEAGAAGGDERGGDGRRRVAGYGGGGAKGTIGSRDAGIGSTGG